LNCGGKNSGKKREINSPKIHGQAKGGGRTTATPKYVTDSNQGIFQQKVTGSKSDKFQNLQYETTSNLNQELAIKCN
jgi:hypothetical protein